MQTFFLTFHSIYVHISNTSNRYICTYNTVTGIQTTEINWCCHHFPYPAIINENYVYFFLFFLILSFLILGFFHFIAVSVDQGEYSKGRPCKNNVLLIPLKLKTCNIMKTATFYLNYCFQK